MAATQTQQVLREWRVLEKLWSDADYNGTTEKVMQNGRTTATDEEMKKWTGKDADLNPDSMHHFSGNGYEEGSYTLQVRNGEHWNEITHFSLEIYTCEECGCEFGAVLSSDQVFDFVPKHGCWGNDDHEG